MTEEEALKVKIPLKTSKRVKKEASDRRRQKRWMKKENRDEYRVKFPEYDVNVENVKAQIENLRK